MVGPIDARAGIESGLGAVESLLGEAGLELAGAWRDRGRRKDEDTGLRIAISYAKSLAFGARLPLVGVSSFDILDAAAGAAEAVPRLTVVEGRPGVICVRRTDAEGQSVACGRIDATVRVVREGEPAVWLVGATEGVRSAVGERATSVLTLPMGSMIPAATLLVIARNRAPAASAHAVTPDYGEIPAARPNH